MKILDIISVIDDEKRRNRNRLLAIAVLLILVSVMEQYL